MRYVDGRTQMIAGISHDFRTPLTSLRIRAELIDDEELRLAMIATLDDMNDMVGETLEFARNDAVREDTCEVDVGAIVQEVVADQRAMGREIQWQAPRDILYRCRPLNLKRALRNLVENAVQYGQAWVRVVPGQGDDGLRIVVEDNGPGIAPDQIERAFEPFFRLDQARSQETGRLGLGLAIARSCIRAHGGEISLHNRAEGGLRATISLPF